MKVSGKLEVEIVVETGFNKTAVVDMFKKAISSALNVSIEYLVRLTAVEILSGSRRLQSNETVRYEVSYEVLVPSFVNPAILAAKANLIAEAGSSQAQLFQQVLAATEGVAEVRNVVLKEPATADEVNPSIVPVSLEQGKTSEEEQPLKAWAIGGGAALLALICFITGANVVLVIILIKQKRSSFEWETDAQSVRSLNNGQADPVVPNSFSTEERTGLATLEATV